MALESLIKIVGPYRVTRGGESIPVNCLDLTMPLRSILDYPEDPVDRTPFGHYRLKGYQRRAVSFMTEALHSHGLDALGFQANGCSYYAQPGMGKTFLSLQAIWRMGLLGQPGMIVGPLQALDTWCAPNSDPARCFDLRVVPWDQRKATTSLPGNTWTFVHYEVLDDNTLDIGRLPHGQHPYVIIFDESHCIANPAAQRTRASRALSGMASVRYRIGLTATPIRTGRQNLWSQLDCMQPGQWGTAHEFSVRYVGLEQNRSRGGQVYWRPTGATNTAELRARINSCTLKVSRGTAAALGGTRVRRTAKRLVLTGSERSELQEAILSAGRKAAQARQAKNPKIRVNLGGFRLSLNANGAGAESTQKYPEKLVALTHAITAMASVKVRHAAREALSLATQHARVIVFTERRESAKVLTAELRETAPETVSILGPVDGGMLVAKRWAVCAALGDYDHAILVGTAGSIGVSNHSLRTATAALMVTPFWNPDTNLQVEGRLLSEGDNVETEKESVYLFLDGNPVDERILQRIIEKESDVSDVLGLGPDEAVGRDLAGDTALLQDAGALWDGIIQHLQVLDPFVAPGMGEAGMALAPESADESTGHAGPTGESGDVRDAPILANGPVPVGEPTEELVDPLTDFPLVPAEQWALHGAPPEALACLESLDEDTLAGLGYCPGKGWAVIVQDNEDRVILWQVFPTENA